MDRRLQAFSLSILLISASAKADEMARTLPNEDIPLCSFACYISGGSPVARKEETPIQVAESSASSRVVAKLKVAARKIAVRHPVARLLPAKKVQVAALAAETKFQAPQPAVAETPRPVGSFEGSHLVSEAEKADTVTYEPSAIAQAGSSSTSTPFGGFDGLPPEMKLHSFNQSGPEASR
jgi:hypothetical protein